MIKHIKGIDTLRAIAAIIVVFGHIELLKKNNGFSNLIDANINFPSGHLAVILFFVISGFIITFLLTKEKEKEGRISFKKFYLRRVLRIWPLYYTILFLSYILFNPDYTKKTIILCLSIFPNIAHALNIGWSISPQIWSIGVEEQFYLFWPLLFTIIPEKKIIITLIAFFIGYSLLPHVICFINVKTLHNNEFSTIVYKFFYGTKFNCMSIGALIGFLYAKKHTMLRFLGNKYIGYLSIILSIFLWIYDIQFKYFTDEFYSLLFVIAMYNIVINPNINIDNKITSFLGKISYGIYMYHWIVILLVLKYFPVCNNIILYNVYIYIIILFMTLLISWMSYNTIEMYFLNIKKRFEISFQKP